MAPLFDHPLSSLDEDHIAAERKTGPLGRALKVVGVLCAVCGFVLSIGTLMALMDFQGDNVGDGMIFLILLFVAVLIGPFAMAAGGVTALGSRDLRDLRSQGWADAGVAAALMASGLGGFLCFLAWLDLSLTILALPGLAMVAALPVGAWALVVMSDPIVKSALR